MSAGGQSLRMERDPWRRIKEPDRAGPDLPCSAAWLCPAEDEEMLVC